MKHNLALAVLMTLIMALTACAPKSAVAYTPSAPLPNEDVLRLHVIANSDSEFDQAAKLAVRDAVLEAERSNMAGARNAKEAGELMSLDAQNMLEAARGALLSLGAEQSVRLSYGDYTFPTRTYIDKTYPEGVYRALRITLGDGEGQNWWCVMFPPLCIVDLGDGKEALDTSNMSSLFLELIKSIDGGKLWAWIEENWR